MTYVGESRLQNDILIKRIPMIHPRRSELFDNRDAFAVMVQTLLVDFKLEFVFSQIGIWRSI